MPAHGTVGDILDQVVSGFTNAIFYIFQRIANAISSRVADGIAKPIIDTMLYTPLPKHCPGGREVSSCGNPQPALVNRPTNGPWPEIWDLYWGRFFVAALSFGLLLYVMANFVASIPWVSPRFREELRGGYLRLLVSLVLGWPVIVVVLYIINGLNYLIAPSAERFAFLLTNIVGGMVIAAAGPMAILTTLLSMVSLTLLLLNLAAYILRIVYLLLIPAIAPVMIMAYSLRLPIGKELSRSLFGFWVKLGLTPMVVGGALRIALIIMTNKKPGGGYEYAGLDSFGGLGVFINLAMGFVIPLIGILGMYLIVVATAPAGAGRATTVAAYTLRNRRTSSSDNDEDPGGDDGGSGGSGSTSSQNSVGHDWGREHRGSMRVPRYSAGAQTEQPVTKDRELAPALDRGRSALPSAESSDGGTSSTPGPSPADDVGTVLSENLKEMTRKMSDGGSGASNVTDRSNVTDGGT